MHYVGKLQIFYIAAVGTCSYHYDLKVQSAGSWGRKRWCSTHNNMGRKIYIYSCTSYKTLNKRRVDFQDVIFLATLSNKGRTSRWPLISRYIVTRIWTFEDSAGCFTVSVYGNHSFLTPESLVILLWDTQNCGAHFVYIGLVV